jgi:type I restriction enzyme, S subunit
MELLRDCAVEWKALGEVAKIQRGRRLVKSELEEFGNYAVLQNCMTPLGYYHEYNVQSDTTFIISAGAAGEIGYSSVDFWAADDVYYFITPENLKSKFLYYSLLTRQTEIISQVRRASVPRLPKTAFEKMSIPIPPLHVQSEIVRILDNFAELTAELTAELSARKKQYSYYRDQLLSFENGEVEFKPLGEIGEVRMCKRILKEQTLPDGEVPFYKIGTFGKEPDAYIARKLFEEYKAKYNYPKIGDILISASGTIGRTVIFDGKDSYFQDSNIVWIENNEKLVLNKYLFYCYQIANWGISEGGTIQRLYNDNLRKLKIPVPYPNDPDKSLVAQEKIVSILDKFDTLTNSISEGLPREIELRQKQHEYYRDMLLTFPKVESKE